MRNRLAGCLFAATLAFIVAVDARGQYFTPAPVDLTGKVPKQTPQASVAIDEYGEVLVWNGSGFDSSATFLAIFCEAGCLDPDGFVSLRDQAEQLGLADTYDDLYGPDILNHPPLDQTQFQVIALASYITLPAGREYAFSIGRIIQGNPAEILQLVEDEAIRIRWERGIVGNTANGEYPVHFTTFVPEPGSLLLAAVVVLVGLRPRSQQRLSRPA